MAEMRVGKKIQKWDEVSGTTTETVDIAIEVPEDGKRNPIRSLEDQIEQNDNMLDGIINNLPEETIAEKEERTSVISKLHAIEPRSDKIEQKLFPELSL
ncbi:DUF4316 domain-containing protein [Pseudobutyrivibrio sp.]|uniref:DUF4316 domain-containing protein n=1 Tax=Pseudobutyrivibrio sp. TaxID=2014367 RepID=UPI001B531236|nr:DUF4316 domain-containing protein [Pseudobutyrivibrio sp.]MBP3261202.1 DUF4316 domain-containing protein [Pseudobutyrivibrio sp.]